MSGTAIINVRFDYAAAEVVADCVFNVNKSELRFSLSDSMVITTGKDALSFVREWQPRWGHPSVEYSVKTKSGSVQFSYRGRAEGWCNIIEEDRSAVSSYASWFPFELSEPVDIVFELPDMADYTIVNGRYGEHEKLWRYGGEGYDEGNVIALKNSRLHIAAHEDFSFYYRFASEKPLAECYVENYSKIVNYYNSIFPRKEPGKMSAAILGIDFSGAYYRKGLVVIANSYIPRDKSRMEDSVVSLLGHELGHNWFLGADSSTWHDWLNETGAEWAHLLYVLKSGGEEHFEKQFTNSTRGYKDTPPIKPHNGNKRPDNGVHSRGVALLGKIYRRHGAGVIIELLRALAELETVSTENYLAVLRRINHDDIAEYIEMGLSKTGYLAFD